MPWYCARLKPAQDRLAMDGLRDQRIENYRPMLMVERISRGRISEGTEPLFPNYLFVNIAPEPALWRAVNYTRGVVRLLGAGPDNIPVALRNGEVEGLQTREAQGKLRMERPRKIRAGDLVQFKYGLLAGRVGLCHSTRRQRITVLLSMLGSASLVQTPRDMLRRIDGTPMGASVGAEAFG